jgi:hypothetical protein
MDSHLQVRANLKVAVMTGSVLGPPLHLVRLINRAY